MGNLVYLFAAYSVIWVGLFAYLINLSFKNRALRDTIYRVGCDLNRKLGANDRLAGAIKEAINLELPYDKILYALICGFHFRAKDENGNMLREDTDFLNRYQGEFISILKTVSGFDESNYIHR